MIEFDWEQTYWNNSVADYAFVLGYSIGVTLVIFLLLKVMVWRLKGPAEAGKLPVFLAWQALQSTRVWLVFSLIFFVALFSLELPLQVYPWLKTFCVTLVMVQILLWGNRALTSWADRYDPSQIEEMGSRFTTVKMFLFFARLVFFVVCFIVIIDNFPGVEITALVAGLGIGGIAVALALQNILSDIFASLTITLDKPFVLGDFIIVGDHMGAVERIGLKTTHIRSLSGEQLIFANNDLLSSRIRNFKRMQQRRVAFELGVTYDTPPEKLRAVPPKVKEIIEALDDTRFDRAHFKAHADFSLVFEIVYYVDGADFNRYMDRQQAINLAIHEYFTEQEIEFAFPTQTLYMKQDDPAIRDALEAIPFRKEAEHEHSPSTGANRES